MVAGRWRVREGHHDAEDSVLEGFRSALAELAE